MLTMKLLIPPINVCPMRGRDEMKNERLFPLSTLYPVLALIMEAASSKGARLPAVKVVVLQVYYRQPYYQCQRNEKA